MPFYVVSGSMFPIALLPFWSQGFSLALGPTWGIDAMRYAAYTSYSGTGFGYWFDIIVAFASTAVYLGIGFWLFIIVERRVRRDATLAEY
jgi:ABC-type multidrug transport system permease subunit